jgi:hypothetical protein
MGQQWWMRMTCGMILSCGAAACSGGGDAGSWQSNDVGSVKVALTATTPSGATYQLSNAAFEITNLFSSPPFDRTVSSDDDPTLQVDLPPSVFAFDYQITLRDGWTLNAVNSDGSLQPLGATLAASAISFTIKPQRTTPVAFQFKASEQVITMGGGTIAVKVAVDDTLIDDFEDGDGILAPLGGRRGFWFTFNDGTGTETPRPSDPVIPEVTDTSADLRLHVTGSGLAPQGTLPDGSFAFGAGVGSTLLSDDASGKALAYDASKYGGIAFQFFTVSGQSFPLQVSFLIGTSATTPIDQGGECDPKTQVCSDDFGFVGFVPPGQFEFEGGFSWAELRQQGFGTPVAFDPSKIITIKWIMSFPNFGQTAADDQFDFQLDDVTFTMPGGLGSSRAARASSPRWGAGAP